MTLPALSPAGVLTVDITGPGDIRVWATASGQQEWTSRAPLTDPRCAVFAPGHASVAVADWGGTVHVAMPDGAVRTIVQGGEPVANLAFRHDSEALAILTGDGRIHVVGAGDGTPIGDIAALPARMWRGAVAFDPAGSGLFSASEGGIGWYDIASGRQRGLLLLPGRLYGHVYALDLSADGRWLAAGTSGSCVVIWRLPDDFWVSDGATVATAAEYEGIGPIGVLRFAPDASTLAVGATAGVVEVLDTSTGRRRTRLRGLGGWISDIAYADGTLIAVDRGAVAAAWDLTTGRRRYRVAWREPNTAHGPYDPLGWEGVATDDPGWLRVAKRYDWLALNCADPAGARGVPAAFAAILAGQSRGSEIETVVETQGMAHEAAVPVAEMTMRAILDGDAAPDAVARLISILISIVGEGSYGTDACLGHADLAADARDAARPLLPYLQHLLADPSTPPGMRSDAFEVLQAYGIDRNAID